MNRDAIIQETIEETLTSVTDKVLFAQGELEALRSTLERAGRIPEATQIHNLWNILDSFNKEVIRQ